MLACLFASEKKARKSAACWLDSQPRRTSLLSAVRWCPGKYAEFRSLAARPS